MTPGWAIMTILALVPMAIRLWNVLQVGRRVHWFDDIVSYLALPMIFLIEAVSVSPGTRYAIGAVLGVVILVSIYRLIRNVGVARGT